MNAKKQVSKEILYRIRQVKIATRKVLRGVIVGETKTAIRGSGFEFDQIREYQPGDDVRFIDWNASARTGSLLVKQYIEERNRVVYLLVDVSGSGEFGTSECSKRDVSAQVASIVSLASFYAKDQVGVVFFSDQIEKSIPPSKQLHHINTCIEEFFSLTAKGKTTDINCAIEFLLAARKRNALVFIISDFVCDINEKKLAPLSRHNDVVAVRCLHAIEKDLPDVGIIHLKDIESGHEIVINTSDRKALKDFYTTRLADQEKIFKKHGISLLHVEPDTQHLAKKMITFFAKRMGY